MRSSPFTAVYDACVLYPAPLRDFLMWLGLSGRFRARWSRQIHDEWKRNLLINRPDLTSAQLDGTSDLTTWTFQTFDGGNAQQCRQSIRRQSPQGPPGTFELVDTGDEAEHLGRDLDGGGSDHGEPFLHPFTPIPQTHRLHLAR